MSPSLKEVLLQNRIQNAIGRDREINRLLDLVRSDDPAVVHVHGLGGIGKSVLLNAFVERARSSGIYAVSLDCRHIEPSEKGFLHDLGAKVVAG